VVASACSLINGNGFQECASDQDCGGSRVCVERYCLPLPPECRRSAGSFDRPDSIRFAALLPLTAGLDGGATNDPQVAGLDAFELAVRDVNESGGVNGRRFSLYVCNTGREADALISQSRWLIEQLGVPAIFTSGSDETATLSEFSARLDAGTLIMSARATSPELIGLHQRRGGTWRTAPPDTLQVSVMANLITTEPALSSITRVAIFNEAGTYGTNIASRLAERLRARGKTVELIEFRKPLNVADRLTALQQFHNTALGNRLTVFVGFPPEVVPFITATRSTATLSAASGHRWFFSDSAKDPSIVTRATASELVDALGTTPAQGAGSAFMDFRARYFGIFKVEPTAYSFTGHSYDAAFLVMLATAAAEAKGGAITGPRLSEGMGKVTGVSGSTFRVSPIGWRDAAAALAEGKSINLEGASGALDFDLDAGAPASPYEVWQVTDGGTITTVKLVNP
jgi:branched-chain amino acid transport system substrate-binding protein